MRKLLSARSNLRFTKTILKLWFGFRYDDRHEDSLGKIIRLNSKKLLQKKDYLIKKTHTLKGIRFFKYLNNKI